MSRRSNYSDVDEVAVFIQREIAGSGQLHGYRWMHLKCLQAGYCVPQGTIRRLLLIIDPVGVQLRKKKKLHKRLYSNRGPNYLWYIDAYDKLKPYGIGISGCIDGFSRHIMWLTASCKTNDSKVIAGFYVKTLEKLGGFPHTIRCDMGTENGYTENMQIFLHLAADINHNRLPPFLYGTSQANQRLNRDGVCYVNNAQNFGLAFLDN